MYLALSSNKPLTVLCMFLVQQRRIPRRNWSPIWTKKTKPCFVETYWNILKHIETYWNILKREIKNMVLPEARRDTHRYKCCVCEMFCFKDLQRTKRRAQSKRVNSVGRCRELHDLKLTWRFEDAYDVYKVYEDWYNSHTHRIHVCYIW